MDEEIRSTQQWKDHLPAILILGSPVVAAGMMLTVVLTDMFLLLETTLMRIGITLIVPINLGLGCLGAAVGALRVGGNVSTRIAVLIVSVGFAAAVYGVSLAAAIELIPGFKDGFEKYGP